MHKAVQKSWIGNMYAHKNRRDDRCRIASARLEIRQILRTDFCGQGCYSSTGCIDVLANHLMKLHSSEDRVLNNHIYKYLVIIMLRWSTALISKLLYYCSKK